MSPLPKKANPRTASSFAPSPATQKAAAAPRQSARQTLVNELIAATEQLSRSVGTLTFAPPVTNVCNPLEYAGEMHRQYLERFALPTCQVIFVGMNPGPWGMAQNGIPFGEIPAVRDWLKLSAPIAKPAEEHGKRPITGLDCSRSEVSGQRLWGLFRERFGEPKAFFRQHFVVNYCPLVFMEASGKNRTPDKLPAEERQPLDQICDLYLQQVIAALEPEWVIGVGKFAEDRAKRVAPDGVKIGTILHPSPASPAANRGWAKIATVQLESLGIWTASEKYNT